MNPKTMVVYFSRTGRTRTLAQRLAAEFGTKAEPIREERSRQGFLGYQRSLLEAVMGRDADIDPRRPAPTGRDLVLLGTPIWGWHPSSPVRAFMRLHAKHMHRVAFFCTMGGSGDYIAFSELEGILGRRPEATLALTEREMKAIDSDSVRAKIDEFVKSLRGTGHAGARTTARNYAQ